MGSSYDDIPAPPGTAHWKAVAKTNYDTLGAGAMYPGFTADGQTGWVGTSAWLRTR